MGVLERYSFVIWSTIQSKRKYHSIQLGSQSIKSAEISPLTLSPQFLKQDKMN